MKNKFTALCQRSACLLLLGFLLTSCMKQPVPSAPGDASPTIEDVIAEYRQEIPRLMEEQDAVFSF